MHLLFLFHPFLLVVQEELDPLFPVLVLLPLLDQFRFMKTMEKALIIIACGLLSAQSGLLSQEKRAADFRSSSQ